MTQPKVFEFAKELGMQTLELMDKLREWKIPVKSHMAELDEATVALIREKMTPQKEGGKKVVAKKKASVPASAPAAEKKTPAKKKAPAAVAAKAETPATAASDASKKVIRRKAASQEAAAEAKSTEVHEGTPAISPDAESAAEHIPSEAAPAAPVAPPSSESAPEISRSIRKEALEETKTEPAAPVLSEPMAPAVEERQVTRAETPAETQVAPAPAPAVVTPQQAAPAPTDGGPSRPGPRPAIKREVVVGSSSIASDAPRTATRPRGNIVGRMDLSRAAAPARTQGGGPGGGPSGNFGSRPSPGGGGGFPRQGGGGPGGPKGNIRPGFFQAPPTDIPLPDATRDRGFKRKTGGGSGPRPGGGGGLGTIDEGTQREEVVESFLSSEYRKREIVFQPKKKTNLLNREALKTQITTAKASKRVVEMYKTISVAELAKQLKVKAGQITSFLMKNGMMVAANADLDFDTATLVSSEFGFEVENTFKSADELIKDGVKEDADGDAILRAPIVTVMGHVDHGKTSLLDAIKKTDIAAGEAGGITQHIGAYRVTLEDGHSIAFIDTPGHEAFTAMRARGANVTDIAVIVVAADDGVMPQTIEAISHAKSAGVPIIVALNKMDKPGVNPDRIKQQLTEYELVPEEWGGNTIYVPVSALKRTGLKELLEQIYLLAEIQELKANPKRPASGIVIESRVERGRGVVATVLVQNGTLRVGDSIAAGIAYGRVRALLDDKGKNLKEAAPSTPVEVLGLNEVPAAGDRFDATENEAAAREISNARKEELQKAPKLMSSKMSLEDLFSKVQTGDVKELVMVVKVDVAGSGEALRAQLEKLSTSEVKVKVIHSAVGGITESDVLLASTAKGIIIGFNVRPDGPAASLAQREGVEIKTYSIIYELLDDVRKAMSGLLTPETVEKTLGRVEVRNVFTLPKAGTIAGCHVTEGKVVRSALVRLVREGRVVYEGKIGSLRRFKDDVREVAAGFECGLGIENYNDLKVGDVVEVFEKQLIAREV